MSPEARIESLLGQVKGLVGHITAVEIELVELREALRHDDTPDDDDVEYTIKEVCAKLDVSRQTLHAWWSTGSGPPKRQYGRRVRIARSDFLAWQRSRTRAGR